MKKTLLILPVLALMGCNSDVKEIDRTMTGCEKIASTSSHVVYKCPASQEWVAPIKAMEPTGRWVNFSGIDETKLSEMANDTEHVYVEFAFDQPGWTKLCKEDYTMRTMLKEPGNYNWAFVGCK